MSADHTELRESARKLLGGVGTPAGEDKLWPRIVELGWLLATVPEELGGLELGFPAACVLHAELGAGLSGAPYLPATLAVEAVCQSNLAGRAKLVERFGAAERVTASLAETTISVSGGRVNGLAKAVQSADVASHLLVSSSDGEVVALSSLQRRGVEVSLRRTWDQTRRWFDVRFTDVVFDEALLLASGPAARSLSQRLNTQRNFALAADCVGASGALLMRTIDYLRTREQYGRPLAMFQALKHRCADLKMHVTAAEALLVDSLDRFTDDELGSHDAALLAKMTKRLAASVFAQVAEEAVQLHGGIGMTAEHPCHLYLKRALLNEQLGVGSESYSDVLSGLLDRRPVVAA